MQNEITQYIAEVKEGNIKVLKENFAQFESKALSNISVTPNRKRLFPPRNLPKLWQEKPGF